MIRRLAPVVVLACAVLAFGLLATRIAQAAPRAASSPCTWQTNGQTIEVEGVAYTCHCERVPAIREVWCTWMAASVVAKANREHRRVKRPAKLVVRLVVRAVPR